MKQLMFVLLLTATALCLLLDRANWQDQSVRPSGAVRNPESKRPPGAKSEEMEEK